MKTSELIGPALDWAVAKCEPDDTASIYFDENGEPICHDDWPDNQEFKPSTNWAQGGPIIEREGIDIHRVNSLMWSARWWADNSGMVKNPAQRFRHNIQMDGPTPLVAAMRCYVASKLGHEIEVPEQIKG